jgi:aldehyde:ferredoxin oxidoreductase
MKFGYHGKILHVDLTAQTITIEEPEETFYRKYFGGSAMGAYYLLKHTPAGADPLGPENTLSLMLGPATGTAIAGQARVTSTAKSPLTGLIGDAQGGGYWPAELKFAGFDGIVIHGQADRPVYLWVNNGKAELRDASHLWGKFTADVEDAIREELNDKRIEVLQCGPAGEKGVRFAALISYANRANGRTGMGAVMGSKNLKAVAVRGNMRPKVADPDGFKSVAKWGCWARPAAPSPNPGQAACRPTTGPLEHLTKPRRLTAKKCTRPSPRSAIPATPAPSAVNA